MKQITILKFLFGLFLMGLGVVIGIAIRHYHNVPLAETINIIDVATLVTTIFLAVYIPEVLDRRLQVKRDKKELIEERVEELQALYRKINMLVQQESASDKDKASIKNTLDVCQHKLETIVTLLSASGMKASFSKEIRKIERIGKEHKELLWNNKEAYTTEVKEKEETLYNAFDKETCLLVFKISDA